MVTALDPTAMDMTAMVSISNVFYCTGLCWGCRSNFVQTSLNQHLETHQGKGLTTLGNRLL